MRCDKPAWLVIVISPAAASATATVLSSGADARKEAAAAETTRPQVWLRPGIFKYNVFLPL
jgi:hypothetical protein